MNVDDLDNEQRAAVLRFLLTRMNMATRHDLMRELPVTYVRLFPTTATAVLEHVRDEIARIVRT